MNLLKKQKNLHLYLLALILLIGFFFRFYDTPARYSLDIDATRDALVALQGAKTLQLPLTGPFSSLGAFTFGPWYFYELITFSLITHLPYAPWIFLGVASFLLILVMYKAGSIVEGKYFGLLLALFIAVSPFHIGTAISLTNPNLISFYAGLSILLFIMLIKRNLSYWWYFLFGIVLGIGLNHHYQMSGLLILPILLLLHKPKRFLGFLISILGIFLTFLPLIFFDLNNHWYTVRNMFYFYTEGRKAFYVPNRWLFYIRDFWPSFWSYILGLPQILGGLTFLLFVLITPILALRKKLPTSIVLLFVAFCFNFLLLRYYWGERSFGYLQFFSPLIFILFAFLLWTILKLHYGKYIGIVLISVFVLLTAFKSIMDLGSGSFEAITRRQAALLASTTPHQKIALYNCKNGYLVRTQAISLLLSYENKLDDSGRKMGFLDGHCKYPKNKMVVYDPYNPDLSETNLQQIYPTINKDVIDFSIATESAIEKEGWTPINPRVVFNSVTRWWFTEQP